MTKPILNYKSEFKELLKNYQMSEHAAGILKKLNLALIVGPTSVGKNAIIAELVKLDNYMPIVSDTTRPPRMENGKMEEHGVKYFFRKEKDLLNELKEGEFLEASVIHEQQVSGISIRELERIAQHDSVAINEIETVGVDNIMKEKPDTHAVFILPPSFEEWLRRLNMRGQMADSELRNRMNSMKLELQDALANGYYRFVVNDDLDTAISDIRSIVEDSQHSESKDLVGQNLAKKLLAEVTERLGS